jgi:hypothetical protein
MSNPTSTPETKLLLTEEQILSNNQWLPLRSGEWRQCTKRLHSEKEDAYCCLGVACEINKLVKGHQDWDKEEIHYFFPKAETESNRTSSWAMPQESWFESHFGWTPFGRDASGSKLPLLDIATLNDKQGKSFTEIASIVEAFLFEHFSNFKIP